MTLDFLKQKLDKRVQEGNLRTLRQETSLIDFVSNDYLGLARSQELHHQIMSRIEEEDHFLNGGTGSRLLSGNHQWYTATEDYLKTIFQAEAVLIFNSGYAANQAVVSALAGRGDTVLYDQLSHVCLKEGAWLSRANTVAFAHNDLADLKTKLSQAKGNVFIVTESIFSMDGDRAPLEDIISLAKKYGAYVIVDEAHSTGVEGPQGAGTLVKSQLSDQVLARIYTFGKAMGVHGACVAGSQLLIDYLINFGRTFIYTTSLPPHSLIAIEESFRLLAEKEILQKELSRKIDLFKYNFPFSKSDTAIQPIMVGDNQKAREIGLTMQEDGFDVRPILSPTVPVGTERMRVSLHVHNEDDQILALARKLKELLNEM